MQMWKVINIFDNYDRTKSNNCDLFAEKIPFLFLMKCFFMWKKSVRNRSEAFVCVFLFVAKFIHCLKFIEFAVAVCSVWE